MDFMLTEQQQMMKKLFAEFAEKEVKPLAAEVDEDERFPRENVEKMKACKMMGIPFSRGAEQEMRYNRCCIVCSHISWNMANRTLRNRRTEKQISA